MSRKNTHQIPERKQIESPPSGWERFRWFGPGLLWMVSSVGSGSVLFTPRIGSRYKLQLLWIALLGAFSDVGNHPGDRTLYSSIRKDHP